MFVHSCRSFYDSKVLGQVLNFYSLNEDSEKSEKYRMKFERYHRLAIVRNELDSMTLSITQFCLSLKK
ncbi:hypothetical protein LBHB_04805 [Leptospira borgpetersenii serovar Hardjo]|nr:hypothetical protein LBHB_04805 [Leptospira borgpetersenii serovar Hardjo]